MLIHQASAPETSGGFLHAGYLSTSGHEYSYDYEGGSHASTGYAPATEQAQPPQVADVNLPLLALVGAGLVLVKLDKQAPLARRRIAALTISLLGLAGMLLPVLAALRG